MLHAVLFEDKQEKNLKMRDRDHQGHSTNFNAVPVLI